MSNGKTYTGSCVVLHLLRQFHSTWADSIVSASAARRMVMKRQVLSNTRDRLLVDTVATKSAWLSGEA